LWECKPHVFVGILTKSSLGRAPAVAKTASVANLLEELKQFFEPFGKTVSMVV
jgi:hypothetical protein